MKFKQLLAESYARRGVATPEPILSLPIGSTVSFREEFFPSLPYSESKNFVNDREVSRAQFMHLRGEANRYGQVIADETHSAGGKTVRHVITKL